MKNLTHQINRLSWRQVAGINLSILTLAGGVLIQKAVSQPTRTTSLAAPAIQVTPSVPVYPDDPPQINPIMGPFVKVGDMVRIEGKNFGDYRWDSQIGIEGNDFIESKLISAWHDTYIDITIPDNTRSGAVYVIVNNRYAYGSPLYVYKPNLDPQLALIISESSYRLDIQNPVSNSRLNLVTDIPLSKDSVKYPALIDPETKTVYFELTSASHATLIDSPQPFRLLEFSLTDNSGQLTPFYIHPSNPLNLYLY